MYHNIVYYSVKSLNVTQRISVVSKESTSIVLLKFILVKLRAERVSSKTKHVQLSLQSLPQQPPMT